MTNATKIATENVVSPRRKRQVDAAKYEAMKIVMLSITPSEAPGLSAAEMREKMLPLLPQDLWPTLETRLVGGKKQYSLISRQKVFCTQIKNQNHCAGGDQARNTFERVWHR